MINELHVNCVHLSLKRISFFEWASRVHGNGYLCKLLYVTIGNLKAVFVTVFVIIVIPIAFENSFCQKTWYKNRLGNTVNFE